MWPQIKPKRGQMTEIQKQKYQEEKDRLIKKYDSSFLSREQTAKELKMSDSTLDRLKKKGYGPLYSKDKGAKNSSVRYPIYAVAEYIVLKNIKTI